MNKNVRKIIIHTLLIVGGIIMLFPFIWMILGSFKTYQEITKPGVIFPSSLSLVNYIEAMKVAPFGQYFLNTVFVAASSTVLVVITTIFAAFAFSKLDFPFKDLIFSILIATMMVPSEMLILTNFATISKLGLYNSLFAMVIPYMASIFYIFMLRQFFMQIPKQIYLAAKIDGCSDWKFLWRIMVPNAKNAISTIALFNWIASWNAYLWPLLVTADDSKRVLSIGLRFFSGEAGSDYHLIMAAGTIVVAPLIVIFLVARDRIIEGISKGGIKG
jgi:multiple sugar transport system permease protein